jgi:hypothetical protein
MKLEKDLSRRQNGARACHQLAGFGRWAPPGQRIGAVSPDCHTQAGLHHTAFEYESFDELMSSYARLKGLGIEPDVCFNLGVDAGVVNEEIEATCAPGFSRAELQGGQVWADACHGELH